MIAELPREVGNDFSCSNLTRHFALDLIVHHSDPKTRKVQIADVCVVAHRTVQLPGTDVMCVRRKMRELVDFDRLGDCPLPNRGTTMRSRRITCIPTVHSGIVT